MWSTAVDRQSAHVGSESVRMIEHESSMRTVFKCVLVSFALKCNRQGIRWHCKCVRRQWGVAKAECLVQAIGVRRCRSEILKPSGMYAIR